VEAADAAELRVLGSLIEKQRTTPDAYPLSLNALRLACNQSSSRDPVAEYDEPTIRAALERLSRKGWVRLASGRGSRAVKYRHLFDEALGLPDPELALLAVLMLRGPQTLGELRQRTERLYAFHSLEDVERTLRALIDRQLVAELPRRRYGHLLGGEEAPTPEQPRISQITPMISYEDPGAAAEWLVAAFGFEERFRITEPDGRVTHVDLALGNGAVMLGCPSPEYRSPKRHREECEQAAKWLASPYVVDGVHVYVDDVDAHYEHAVAAGANALSQPADEPHGDRLYRVEDLEGHRWMFATRLSDGEAAG
jgi:uncharacterized protein YceH (UPF0502 family)